MKANTLARHYDALTPEERLPLIMAASGRGDEAERQRLVLAAPTVTYRVPDHFGRAHAFADMSNYHFMALLDLAAVYLPVVAMADAEHADAKRAGRLFGAAQALGYVFGVKLAGWRQFCAGISLDPELCWSCLPGFQTIKRAEELAGAGSFGAAEMAAYLKGKGKGAPQPLTAADVAADLHRCFAERADWWG
jgi:hypothetical protein